jgi:hypothetical protein
MTTNSIPLADLESSPSAKFAEIGDTYVGRIVSMVERQQTDMKQRPLTFDDGTPRMQWVITIETAEGDRAALYAKGGKFKAAAGKGESMLAAIGIAVRAANADGVDVGGELAVSYTGTGEAKPGQDGPKLYTAAYKPPAPASIPAEDLFSKRSD